MVGVRAVIVVLDGGPRAFCRALKDRYLGWQIADVGVCIGVS